MATHTTHTTAVTAAPTTLDIPDTPAIAAAPFPTTTIAVAAAAAPAAPVTPTMVTAPTRVGFGDEHRGGKGSGCPSGGRAPWVGVGVGGSRFSSPPATSSAERRNTAARRAAGAARSPLAAIPTNAACRAGTSTAAKRSKTTAFVATPGFASLTRETESRKVNKKPEAQVAAPSRETKRASAVRSSTRTGMAGPEKAEGMAGRLRSAGRTQKKHAENTAPSFRDPKKVPSGTDGVSSRTRQGVAARKAAAAGKEVARRRWRF